MITRRRWCYCLYCRVRVNRRDNYCSRCGKDIKIKRCYRCDCIILPYFKYCPSCGKLLKKTVTSGNQEAQAHGSAQNVQTNEQQRSTASSSQSHHDVQELKEGESMDEEISSQELAAVVAGFVTVKK